MLDENTFLTTLYVMADDFCKLRLKPRICSGPAASLTVSEIITLGIYQQHWKFRSERSFYDYADKNLRDYFPNLPDRSQYNRLFRQHWRSTVAFWQSLVDCTQAQRGVFEALDSVPAPVRNIKRAGEGRFAGIANIGWSTRLGWYEGFHVLVSANSVGFITGFGFGAASEKDQPLADTFLGLRRFPQDALPTVGCYTSAYYFADNGFEGRATFLHWQQDYGATVISAPPRSQKEAWPESWRKWFSGLRQIIETVYDKLLNWFGLGKDRPHDLSGFHARLAAKVALHNFMIYLNLQLGRPALAFANLLNP